MILVDTSVIVDYLQGINNSYTDILQQAIADAETVTAAVVITELLSNPHPPKLLQEFLHEVTPLGLMNGHWERAGYTRARLKAKGLKAKIADTLIAQTCIDHNVPLLTRDEDFHYFEKYCGLKRVIVAN